MKKINWGVYPESPIKTRSLIEMLIAVAVFGFCLYLFLSWYRVPEREVVINVEDLDKNLFFGKNYSPEGKYANIYYNSMMSFDDSKIDTSMCDMKIHIHKYYSSQKYDSLRTNSVMLDVFKKNADIFNDDFEFKNPQSLSNFLNNIDSKSKHLILDRKNLFVHERYLGVDSLRKLFNDSIKNGSSYIVDYVKYSFRQKGISHDTITGDYYTNPNQYCREGRNDEWKWGESFAFHYSNESIYTYRDKDKRCFFDFLGPNPQTKKPNLFSKWDISQSYYKFKINSLTIDSMNIKIDFKGATDFSKLIPEPDEIGMSYIIYTDPYKLTKIKEDGIVFLATFKDLIGYQQIRLFVITGIMGGLFVVFIFFLYLYPTKLYRQFIRNRDEEETEVTNEENKPESDESQETPAIEEADISQEPPASESDKKEEGENAPDSQESENAVLLTNGL